MYKEFEITEKTKWKDLLSFVEENVYESFIIDWYNGQEVDMRVINNTLCIDVGPVDVKFNKEDFSVSWDPTIGYWQIVLKNEHARIFMYNLSVVDRDYNVMDDILVESTKGVKAYDQYELEGNFNECKPLEDGKFLKSYVYYNDGVPGRILQFLMEKEENVKVWLRTTETKHRLK